jgi:hypothetical protein
MQLLTVFKRVDGFGSFQSAIQSLKITFGPLESPISHFGVIDNPTW